MKNNLTPKLIGLDLRELPIAFSRRCGQHSFSHNLAVTKAMENACEIRVSKQTELLRSLLIFAEVTLNHSRDIYRETLPQFLGEKDFSGIKHSHTQIAHTYIELSDFASKILTVISGNKIHPVDNTCGGFLSYPSHDEIKELSIDASLAVISAERCLDLFTSLKYQARLPKAKLISVKNHTSYDFSGNDLWDKTGGIYTGEKIFSIIPGACTGPAARIYFNKDKFLPETKEKIKDKDTDLANIDIAKTIEIFNSLYMIEKILKEFAANGARKEHLYLPEKYGIGQAVIETSAGPIAYKFEVDDAEKLLNYQYLSLSACPYCTR